MAYSDKFSVGLIASNLWILISFLRNIWRKEILSHVETNDGLSFWNLKKKILDHPSASYFVPTLTFKLWAKSSVICTLGQVSLWTKQLNKLLSTLTVSLCLHNIPWMFLMVYQVPLCQLCLGSLVPLRNESEGSHIPAIVTQKSHQSWYRVQGNSPDTRKQVGSASARIPSYNQCFIALMRKVDGDLMKYCTVRKSQLCELGERHRSLNEEYSIYSWTSILMSAGQEKT